MQWTFENYRLDTDNAALWRGDEQVVLRPKTFDVLRYLVEHAGELVRKETLLDAVWQNAFVVEGVLTTSMSELRKVFGDTAKNQRFIATVYRRGYRFIAPVEHPGAGPEAAASADSITTSATAHVAGKTIRKFPRLRGFIGREQECRRLIRLLTDASDCRILSLVGAGGIGKTRLALAVTRMISELDQQPFTDGFYYVPLQSLDNDDDFFSAIAEVLELQFSGGDSQQEHVRNFLENKRALLVLDNFEHLLRHAQALGEMISVAPDLKIMVTSRESLNIEDVWFHPVNGLEVNDSIDCDAVQLFAQRAYRNQPEFDLHEKLPAVRRICRLVEGMPLALELAAAWLKMLSMDEIANEIEKGIDILTDQYGDDGERHGSVRAVLIETWQRLTESERTLLKRFSVFRGGADRAAIGAVIGAGLPILGRLVNKALLRTTRQLRYRMHELIRQFAEEELVRDAASEIEARNQHADYYLRWMGRQIDGLRSVAQGDTCREIQANFDNIRTAWRWAVAQQQIELLRQAIRSVSLFCDLRGYFGDGLALFDMAQDMIEASDQEPRDQLIEQIKVRSGILNFRLSRYDTALGLFNQVLGVTTQDYERALILRFLGDYHFSHAGHISAEQARQYLTECIELCQKINNIQLQTDCLIELSILYTNLVLEIELSQQCAAQAVALARKSGRPDLLATALDVLAWTTNHRGDYDAAEATWREVFDIAFNSGNRSIEALAINWLGWSAWSVGGSRHEEAIQYFNDALGRYQELGDRANVSMTYADLATVLLETGELEQALDFCQRGLALAAEIGRDDHYVYNLYTLGAVECAAGNLIAAREHLAGARTMAWEQEEQTNKPVVLFYITKLLYAEHQARTEGADPVALEQIVMLLLFLQSYRPTWQAFKDRAREFQRSIEAEHDLESLHVLHSKPEAEIQQAVLEIVPTLLD